ncbi:MAG TPA: sigma-70 family RNA polymerase sigma factor [Candidatus Dormibacteraeota bacterium]|nr:sigma-70 family RNA polymerase sigma factor [Candidatus Dormibacteraeota bacterium]
MQRVVVQTGTDEEPVERSFTDLVGGLVDPAFRLACAMLHDTQAAEDAVQEASIIAWRKFKRLDDPSRIRAWFLGIVANECRNARRRGWRSRVQLGLPADLSEAAVDERLVRRADLRNALLQLPHLDRLLVVLFYYFDMPLDEIASVARISRSAARNRLYRTVRRMRPNIALEEALR